MPQTIRYRRGGAWTDKIRYTYDCMGNISAVYEDDELIYRYEYDTLNRLIREDNKPMAKTVLISYDNNGNITSKRNYAYTTTKTTAELEEATYTSRDTYIYNGDRLVSFNGQAFAYDTLGNPTTYRDKALFWTRGRQLSSYNDVRFTYDSYGRRICVDFYGAAYDHNDKLLTLNEFVLLYDGAEIVGFKDMCSFERYAFMKDAQGNVVALLDSNGNVVVQYKYDAWGNHKVLNPDGTEIPADACDQYGNLVLGLRNPFRYRGYIYDTATGLYYLQSRYYDPETGRFINADAVEYLEPETVNGLNLYAYCLNNPVTYSDPSGHAPKWWQWTLFGIGVALVFVAAGLAIFATGGLAAFGVGALIGSLALGLSGAVIGGAIGYAQNGIDGIFEGAITGFGIGAIVGFAVGGVIGTSGASTTTPTIGKPFNPNQSLQIGVDPNTLKYGRALNPQKLQAVTRMVQSKGMYGVIEVTRDGIILDGNHRVAVAIMLKMAVDVLIK